MSLRHPFLPAAALVLAACGATETSRPSDAVPVAGLAHDAAADRDAVPDYGARFPGPIGTPIPVLPYASLGTIGGTSVPNGGFGSALARGPDARSLYLMTDRGANYDGFGGLVFPFPAFAPQIGEFGYDAAAGGFVLRRLIPLRDEAGAPLRGTPTAVAGQPSDIGFTVTGERIPANPSGIDPEGLVVTADGFWVSDEYGPAIVKFDRQGVTEERLTPFSGTRALPLVLGRRRPNRGMEGLTATSGGRILWGAMQSPLDNPRTAGRASRAVRIVRFDTKTGASQQFVLVLDRPSQLISEIVAITPTQFLVIERDGVVPGPAAPADKKIYRVDLQEATDISDAANGAGGRLFGGRTLEELTANAADPVAVLAAAGVTPARKTLILDVIADLPGYPHDKLEGLAIADANTLILANDDDFSVIAAPNGFAPKLLADGVTRDFNAIYFARTRQPIHAAPR